MHQQCVRAYVGVACGLDCVSVDLVFSRFCSFGPRCGDSALVPVKEKEASGVSVIGRHRNWVVNIVCRREMYGQMLDSMAMLGCCAGFLGFYGDAKGFHSPHSLACMG